MPRFFTEQVNEQTAVITGEDARHGALALRLRVGEQVTVCNGQGMDYRCVIQTISPEAIQLQVEESFPSLGEPSVEITLYQALPKGDKLETIIQKSVELGVHRIVPVLTHRCVSRPDARSMEKKLVRYHKIALEAAKQCGRGRIPAVEPLMDFQQAVCRMQQDALALLFYEQATDSLGGLLGQRLDKQVSILVGSEGGFTPEEADFAVSHGLVSCSLGSRILRCETAPLAAITSILYQAGDI